MSTAQLSCPIAAPPVRLWDELHRAAKPAGSDRLIPPAKTLERIRPFFRTAGITRLANITGLDRVGIPVALAIRPNSRSITTSAGKGQSLEEAMVSAAMEGIEVFHAEILAPAVARTTYRDVARSYEVIPVEKLRLRQHASFHPDWPHDWLIGWDLLREAGTAVPFSTVSLRLQKMPYDFAIFESTSNGLASGNNLLEGIISGLLEVIERDAITCHGYKWYGRTPPPLAYFPAAAGPGLAALMELLAGRGLGVLLRDCTGDTQIPVFQAYIYDRRLPELGVHHGYGAHLDAERAALRALLEAVQSRAVYISVSRDDCFQEEFRLLRSVRHSLDQHALLRQSEIREVPVRAPLATDSLEGDVAVLLAALKNTGIEEVIVLDLSRGEFPVNVVKVIVPGLEGHAGDQCRPGPRAIRSRSMLS